MELQSLIEKVTQEIMQSLDTQKIASPVSFTPAAGNSGDSNMGVILVEEEALSLLNQIKNSYPGVKLVFDNHEKQSSRNIFYPVISLRHLSALANFQSLTPMTAEVLKALENDAEVTLILALPALKPALEKFKDKKLEELKQLGYEIEVLRGGAPVTTYHSKETSCSSCQASSGECAGCGQCAQLIPEKVDKVVEAGAERLAGAPGVGGINQNLAKMIDHTLLKPDATKEQVIKLCDEARKYNFASVCINPSFVKLSAECLKGSPVKVCTVIGFPLGATTSVSKSIETRDAIANGAQEIDMVINVGALKARDYEQVRKDIEAVVEAANGQIVKVILETAFLTDEEKVKGCQLSKEAGADFVKTSTGFGPGGATAHDIALMRETVGRYMGVKAAGGIRDYATAQEMIKAGATRIGASASVSIVKGEVTQGKGY
jgi:deoxyribose-phosphate aldolase